MSKKKKDKVKSKKSGKKNPEKKPVKKAAKPSSKKNAAKNTSKPIKAKKAKTVVKKTSAKASKPLKKQVIKNAKPKKAPVKVISKNNISKKAIVKKSAPIKKVAVKKAVNKKAEAKKKDQKSIVKSSKSITKPSKPAPQKAVPKDPKIKVAATKKDAPKPVAPPPISKKEATAPLKKAEDPIVKRTLTENKATNVLAITNTIPVKEKHELPLSKIASISSSITNPIRKTDSYAIRPEKEPNGKFELEFVVHSSAEMLYEFLSTPSGLSEWFCDDLNIRNGIYTFIWDDQLQQARLLKTVELQLVRFQWVDKTDGSYFEFKIQRDDLTNDISLIITDFAENHADRESSKLLWHSQIEKLMHVIGSIF